MKSLAIRLYVVLGALLTTYAAGLIYLNWRFDSGLAPAPFIGVAFLAGLVLGLVCKAVAGRQIAARLSALVLAVALVGMMVSGGSQVFFWLAAVPGVGALAATLPVEHDRSSAPTSRR